VEAVGLDLGKESGETCLGRPSERRQRHEKKEKKRKGNGTRVWAWLVLLFLFHCL